MTSAILVVAKAPVAGFAKTRLTPPLTPVDAAQLAAAALLDTLEAAAGCPAAHRVVALCGDLGAAERSTKIARALTDFRVLEQRGGTFAERLVNAHLDAAALTGAVPTLQIGMDTPQADAAMLGESIRLLGTAPAVLGLATDGGWWALGLRDATVAKALLDVPMSVPETGARTRAALLADVHPVAELPVLTDVDHLTDAAAVAAHPQCGRHFRDCAARMVPTDSPDS